ncbi:MAG: preprotein translocase subunit SecG [Planctomycetes bacterium]|nr:preprotein translocase subunit SecG [Planctomycetota bacterium]
MLAVAWYYNILAVLFGFVALVLMLIILAQRGRGVGLAGAFGGAGGHTAFGAKTGDVLTWATVVVTAVFLFAAVVLNYVFVTPTSTLGRTDSTTAITAEQPEQAPVATQPMQPTPAPAAQPVPTPTPQSPPPTSTAPPTPSPTPTPATSLGGGGAP